MVEISDNPTELEMAEFLLADRTKEWDTLYRIVVEAYNYYLQMVGLTQEIPEEQRVTPIENYEGWRSALYAVMSHMDGSRGSHMLAEWKPSLVATKERNMKAVNGK